VSKLIYKWNKKAASPAHHPRPKKAYVNDLQPGDDEFFSAFSIFEAPIKIMTS
jgi:hypothetical protein